MRAAVLTKLGAPLEIFDGISVPNLGVGQALVKIAYSGVCHSQVMEAKGGRGHDRWLPHMLGHEATGRVISTGSGVTKVVTGDLVVLGWIKGQGCEAGGCQYICDELKINAGGVTTFSDHTVVSENRLVKLPKGVPLDLGVLFGCALPTGAGIVFNEAQPEAGSSVVVFGLGGIGLSALIAARTYDVNLIAVDISSSKLELALKLGADHVIDASSSSPVSLIKQITGLGADFCLECSGQTSVIQQAFLASHPNKGLTIFTSHPPAGEVITLDPHHLIAGRKIQGSWGGASNPDRDVPLMATLWKSGNFPIEELISQKRYSLSEINEALNDLAEGRALRPIIEIDAHV
ncbi:MAG TPA: acetoin dehydrogenase [Gammaproteobacteria bacterium]|nr:acetoin dehydrogenase [Gammaproteobacteria bacterium]